MTVQLDSVTTLSPAVLADQLHCGGETWQLVNPAAVFGSQYQRLPVVLRLLLENVCRHLQGQELVDAAAAIIGWLDNHSSLAEIPYQPGRVLMHDTTSTPALVDIAAMRDTLREQGVDPALLTPTLPVNVSIDHSLAVEEYGHRNLVTENLAHEMRRNHERYRFLRWAAESLGNVTIHPPGTGIMHTINLEQLATVVKADVVAAADGDVRTLVPDMMLGTDSHTPMINGIGVLGWGVGGLEAQTVMFGMPTMLRVPDVVGVKLTGRLAAGVQASDLALTVTNRLRTLGVTGEFVEFFGPGVSTLSASARAVVANMAPEYGATTGFFPVDESTLDYLRTCGRDEQHLDLVRAWCQRVDVWFNPDAEPEYSQVLEIDLGLIGCQVAGPKRPQDLLSAADTGAALRAAVKDLPADNLELPRFPVGLAAITSCTNTSDPALLMAAGLLAKKAVAKGLFVPDWVKTSLAPGSPAAVSYLTRAGVMDALQQLGFGVVGFGCTTCIGNSGPLPSQLADAQSDGRCRVVAALSGNRNFPGRVHPDVDLGFIMSPALVVAFALSGDAERNVLEQPLQDDREGNPVYLQDIWPSDEEVDQALRVGLQADDFRDDFAAASRNPQWEALDIPDSACFPWEADSTILRRPPFAALSEGSLLGEYVAYPLLVVGDDVTTDHISPASAIPANSYVADYLVARGESRDDLNVFASRRGNWEVMKRAAFYNRSLKNLLAPLAGTGETLHQPDNRIAPISEVADQYRDEGQSVVIVGGERYGMGSSRDWAAKGQRLLGVRAVLAVSFERIHRSNLIGMGILPLCFPQGVTPQSLNLQPGDRLWVNADPALLQCRGLVQVEIHRQSEAVDTINMVAAIETGLELELLQRGGVIPAILNRTISKGLSQVPA